MTAGAARVQNHLQEMEEEGKRRRKFSTGRDERADRWSGTSLAGSLVFSGFSTEDVRC